MTPEQEKIKRRYERQAREENEIPVYIVASENYKQIASYARQSGMSTGAVNKIRKRIRRSWPWKDLCKKARALSSNV